MPIALARPICLKRASLHGVISQGGSFGHASRSLQANLELRDRARWTGFKGFSLSSRNLAFKNPYEILGVPRNASNSKIKNQYYALANIYHSDRPTGDITKFHAIKEASQTLLNPKKRFELDKQLAAAAPTPARRPSPTPSPNAQQQSPSVQGNHSEPPNFQSHQSTSRPLDTDPNADWFTRMMKRRAQAEVEARARRAEAEVEAAAKARSDGDKSARTRPQADVSPKTKAKASPAPTRDQQPAPQAQKGKGKDMPTAAPSKPIRLIWKSATKMAADGAKRRLDPFERAYKRLVKNPWAELKPPSTQSARARRPNRPLLGVQSSNPYEQPEDTAVMIRFMQARFAMTLGGRREPYGTKGDPNELGLLAQLYFVLGDESEGHVYRVPFPEEEDDRVLAQWGISHLEAVQRTLMWEGISGIAPGWSIIRPAQYPRPRGDPARPRSRNFSFIPLRHMRKMKTGST